MVLFLSATKPTTYVLDSISSPSAICSPAPYMKSIDPKSTTCSLYAVDLPITGAVTSHTVQIEGKYWYRGMRIPIHNLASNMIDASTVSTEQAENQTRATFPANVEGRERTYPVVRTPGSKVSVICFDYRQICTSMGNHV